MTQSWEQTDARHRAAELRAEVAGWDRILARLDAQCERAVAAEEAYNARMAALRGRVYEVGPRCGRDGVPTRRPSPEELQELAQLERDIAALEVERERWLSETAVRYTDGGGLQRSYSLSPGSVGAVRDRVRVNRALVAGRAAELEAALGVPERVQGGRPSSEYTEHRERIESLRARLG